MKFVLFVSFMLVLSCKPTIQEASKVLDIEVSKLGYLDGYAKCLLSSSDSVCLSAFGQATSVLKTLNLPVSTAFKDKMKTANGGSAPNWTLNDFISIQVDPTINANIAGQMIANEHFRRVALQVYYAANWVTNVFNQGAFLGGAQGTFLLPRKILISADPNHAKSPRIQMLNTSEVLTINIGFSSPQSSEVEKFTLTPLEISKMWANGDQFYESAGVLGNIHNAFKIALGRQSVFAKHWEHLNPLSTTRTSVRKLIPDFPQKLQEIIRRPDRLSKLLADIDSPYKNSQTAPEQQKDWLNVSSSTGLANIESSIFQTSSSACAQNSSKRRIAAFFLIENSHQINVCVGGRAQSMSTCDEDRWIVSFAAISTTDCVNVDVRAMGESLFLNYASSVLL